MFEREVKTDIDIDAPVESVWRVLEDLETFPEWNPMIRHAEGRLEAGERLTVHFNPPGAKLRVFRPKLLVVEPNRELRWLGNPGVPVLFESEHYFILDEISPGRTRLVHNMLFYGLFVPLLFPLLKERVRVPFELMNEAHKERAENL